MGGHPVDVARWLVIGPIPLAPPRLASSQRKPLGPRGAVAVASVGRGLGRAGPGSGLEDDPAGDAASGLRAERLGCLCERIHRPDLGAQVSFVD